MKYDVVYVRYRCIGVFAISSLCKGFYAYMPMYMFGLKPTGMHWVHSLLTPRTYGYSLVCWLKKSLFLYMFGIRLYNSSSLLTNFCDFFISPVTASCLIKLLTWLMKLDPVLGWGMRRYYQGIGQMRNSTVSCIVLIWTFPVYVAAAWWSQRAGQRAQADNQAEEWGCTWPRFREGILRFLKIVAYKD